jgi:hypothetical protein
VEWSALRLRVASAGSCWWGRRLVRFKWQRKLKRGRRGLEAPSRGSRQLCRWAGNPPVHVPLSARGSTARVLLLGRAWRDCMRALEMDQLAVRLRSTGGGSCRVMPPVLETHSDYFSVSKRLGNY